MLRERPCGADAERLSRVFEQLRAEGDPVRSGRSAEDLQSLRYDRFVGVQEYQRRDETFPPAARERAHGADYFEGLGAGEVLNEELCRLEIDGVERFLDGE
jgi:hypothetical protein